MPTKKVSFGADGRDSGKRTPQSAPRSRIFQKEPSAIVTFPPTMGMPLRRPAGEVTLGRRSAGQSTIAV